MASASIYSDAFENAKPTLAYNSISSRLSLTKAYTQDLTSYFHERTLLESEYIKSLQRLSSRLHASGKEGVMTSIDSLGIDRNEEKKQLGAWMDVKRRLEDELGETARVHEVWRKKLGDEVVGPLRSSLTNSGWTRYGQNESNLGATVKDYDSTLDKVSKGQNSTKSSKSNTAKLLASQSHLSTLVTSLTSALPPFLNSAQSLDSTHSAFLKEALVRYGTLSSDLGRERMEMGERVLVSVLGVDEESEMQGWALREGIKAGAGQGQGARSRASTTGTGAGAAAALGEFGSLNGAGGGGNLREESIAEEGGAPSLSESSLRAPASERSRVPSVSRALPPPVAALSVPPPVQPPSASPSKSTGGGGFKFSKILKRDRSSSTADRSSSSAAKFTSLDQPLPPNPPSGAGITTIDTRNSLDSRNSSAPGPEDPTSSFRRQNSSTSGLGLQAPLQPDQVGSGTRNKRDSLMPFASGGLFRRSSKMNSNDSTSGSGGYNNSSSGGMFGGGGGVGGSGLVESPQRELGQSEGGLTGATGAGLVDEEGFSVPPEGYDKQPWEKAATSGGGGANLMDEEDEEASEGPSAIPRLPSVAIAPSTITESDTDRRAALENVKSTLLSSGPTTNLARRATRGRRDVRMTTYNPTIPDDVPLGKILEQQRLAEAGVGAGGLAAGGAAIAAATATGTNGGGSGTPLSRSTFSQAPSFNERSNSILSTVSSTHPSRSGTAFVDPFEHSTTPGLKASVTETVNVLLKGGEVTRVMIAGEIALSHRPTSINSTTPLKIRITNFEQFEKAAPNSTYLTPVPDLPGEYTVATSLGPTTTTVLKYQVHIPEGSEKHFVPLLVNALWKCEANQTRVIVSYNRNGGAKFGPATGGATSPFGEEDEEMSMTSGTKIEDLSFHLPISTTISTFQAKPSATYSADKGRLSFAVDGIEASDTTEKKLLASVQTEKGASAQPVAVRWKVVGRCISGVGVEVGEGGESTVEEVVRTTVAGKYLVAP